MNKFKLKILLPVAIAVIGLGSIFVLLGGQNASPDITALSQNIDTGINVEKTSDIIRVSAEDALQTPNPLGEIVLGDPNAPVTIIEYASLTCGHCGAFHNEVLPEIKRDYVDQGLVKFYFRPFPFDGVAMAGAMLAQCVAPGARLTFLDLLFKRQADLIRNENPFGQLQAFAKQAGLSEAKFMSCIQSQENLEAIRGMQAVAGRELGVNSTPTFFINGEKVSGNVGLEKFRKIIDKTLKDEGI